MTGLIEVTLSVIENITEIVEVSNTTTTANTTEESRVNDTIATDHLVVGDDNITWAPVTEVNTT